MLIDVAFTLVVSPRSSAGLRYYSWLLAAKLNVDPFKLEGGNYIRSRPCHSTFHAPPTYPINFFKTAHTRHRAPIPISSTSPPILRASTSLASTL